MQPKEVAASYDTIASRWQSASFDRTNGIAALTRALAFCQTKGNALDVGCGSSGRFIERLLEEGFSVAGLDLSSEMVRLAQRRHPQVTFHLEDICQWVLPKRYELIAAWDSIWHIPLDQHEPVLAKLMASLNPGGVCLFSMGGLDAPGEVTNTAMGPPMYHSTPGIPKTLDLVDRGGCVCRHLEYDQFPEPHVYLIIQKR